MPGALALTSLEAPPLEPDDLHVWVIALGLPSGTVARLHAELDSEERARAARFATDALRRRFVVAHGALRRILGAYVGVTAGALRFREGERGKPALVSSLEGSALAGSSLAGVVARRVVAPAFNLSHSHEVALLAVTPVLAVGVDVERVRDLESDALARRYFTEAEAAALDALAPAARRDAFFRVWTLKEAFLKCQGHGIAGWLERVDVSAPEEGALAIERIDGDAAPARAFRAVRAPAPAGYVGAAVVRGAVSRVVSLAFPPTGRSSAA